MRQIKRNQMRKEDLFKRGVENSTPIICCCGHSIFVEGVTVARISPLYTPNGNEGFISAPAKFCVACGKPLELTIRENKEKKHAVKQEDVQAGSGSSPGGPADDRHGEDNNPTGQKPE